MRRVGVLGIAAIAWVAVGLAAQEHARTPGERASNPEKEEKYTEDAGHLEAWKWANFIILAGVLGYMIGKSGPAFFRRRTEEIQRGISEAAKQKQEAETRAAKVEMRMASLASEIEHLRADAKAEMEKEMARIRQETEQFIARIHAHGEQEIDAHTRHLEKELRAHAAQLAIELAEQRIRARMSGDAQNNLVDGFLKQLDQQSSSTEAPR